MDRLDLICGCMLCDGDCKRRAERQRNYAISVILQEDEGKSGIDRERYRKALQSNTELVDSIIIYKRLNRLKNGTDYEYYRPKKFSY